MDSYLEVENKTFDDFYLNFCGIEECKPDYGYGPAVRPHHIIHCCLKGKGKYYVGDRVYEIKKGDAFLIMPHVVTYYQADSEDPWTYLWISFSGTKTDQYLKMCNFSPDNLVVHCDYLNELQEAVQSMITNGKLSYDSDFFIQGQLFTFFSYLAKSADISYEKSDAESSNIYISKAIEYIQNNYQGMVTVKELADYLSLNRSYLTTLFKKHLNVSLQEFLIQYRMLRAEELLIETDLPISQIAYSCGYSNQLSFSKSFNNTHKMSPRDFRKTNTTSSPLPDQSPLDERS